MQNYGLIEELREFGEYILGQAQIPYVPFNESGDWTAWLPKYENQTTKLGQETSACTAYGSLSQIECLHKFLYGQEPNYSERYTYNLVPITPGRGANPQNTYETIRKYGVIDDRELPMTDSLDEYTDKSAITKSLLAKGQHWLSQYDFKHEWLWNSPYKAPDNYKKILADALTTCPIGVSVTAWREENGLYVSDNGGNNHWCVLYKIDNDGSMWVFDTYDHSRKHLHPDHNIRRAKRIWLQKRTRKEMGIMISLLQNVIKKLTMKPTLADIVRPYLGTDVTPQDTVPDDVACADTISTILKDYMPHMVSTIKMHEWLSDPVNGFQRVFNPEEGCIIISPTKGDKIGHVGVVMDNELIASNNSFGVYKGKITENYTFSSWVSRYKIKLGLPVYMYKKV